MSRSVHWHPRASNEIEALARRDPRLARRIRQRVAALAQTDYGNIKKLGGQGNRWRLTVGAWRVIFTFEPLGAISVLTVLPRKDAYRA